MTRMITEKGDGVVLVLSAAVLVIVIDARDGAGRGGARGFNTKPRRARRFFWGGGARRGSHGDAEAQRVCLHRETTTWPNGTARGSDVLVLSAAVLVIVIEARATGWEAMARVGDLTETRRSRRVFGEGMARGVSAAIFEKERDLWQSPLHQTI
jgi:hypothetical protein